MKLGVPKVIKMDYQCWFQKWGDPDYRCKERGTWGWTKEAADKAGASASSILRLARWCKEHAHFDDSQLEDSNEKNNPGPSAAGSSPAN